MAVESDTTCVYCGETIKTSAAVCRHCNRSIPQEAATISEMGSRYALGKMTDGRYGVWEIQRGGKPYGAWEGTEEGWRQAWTWHQQAEQSSAQAAQMAQTAQASNGLAVASMILGIVGSAVGLIPLFSSLALICGLVGLPLGGVALSRSSRRGGAGRGMAIAGLVLSIIAIVLAIIGFVIIDQAVQELDEILE